MPRRAECGTWHQNNLFPPHTLENESRCSCCPELKGSFWLVKRNEHRERCFFSLPSLKFSRVNNNKAQICGSGTEARGQLVSVCHVLAFIFAAARSHVSVQSARPTVSPCFLAVPLPIPQHFLRRRHFQPSDFCCRTLLSHSSAPAFRGRASRALSHTHKHGHTRAIYLSLSDLIPYASASELLLCD